MSVILLAFLDPQISAIVILVLCSSIGTTSLWNTESRIIWGCVMLFILAGLDVYNTLIKMNYLRKHPGVQSFKTKEEMQARMDYEGYSGIKFQDVVSNDITGTYQFQIAYWQSLLFEIFVFMLLLIWMFAMFKHHEVLEELKQRKLDIILVKNYELEADDSDEEEESFSLGTAELQRMNQDKKREEAKAKEAYGTAMKKMARKLPRNFVNCEWFKKSNKVMFILLVLSQLTMAMCYEAVIDVPSLCFIVFLCAMYAFRKIYARFYGLCTFFLAYYLNFVSMVKVGYVIAVQIPRVEAYLHDPAHAKYALVVYTKLIFGLDFSNKSGAQATEKVWYYFFLLTILFSSHVWQQQKWGQVRDVLHNSEKKDSWSLIQLGEYFKNTQLEKKKREILSQLVKNERRARERKKGKKSKLGKSLKPSSFQRFKKNIDSILPTLLIWL